MTDPNDSHDLIKTAPVECSERAIARLLDICMALNKRIDDLEADATRERLRLARIVTE